MKSRHTADWQIGIKADFVGKAARIVLDERPVTGNRLIDAANSENAEFVLVAEDLFR